MRSLFFSILLLFSFTACENRSETQTQRDARIAQEAREALMAELKAKEEAEKKAHEKNSTLFKIGISKEENVITIDTNKTKHFFEEIGEKLSKQMEQLSKEAEEGKFSHQEAGIEADEKHIVIDINKTESFLDKWIQKMQNFAKELDELLKAFDNQESQQ